MVMADVAGDAVMVGAAACDSAFTPCRPALRPEAPDDGTASIADCARSAGGIPASAPSAAMVTSVIVARLRRITRNRTEMGCGKYDVPTLWDKCGRNWEQAVRPTRQALIRMIAEIPLFPKPCGQGTHGVDSGRTITHPEPAMVV